MNKSIKILSLALLLSTSIFAAEEVVTEEVVTTEATEEASKTVMDKVKEAAQAAINAAGEKREVTEEAISNFFDRVDANVSDKAAYIKEHIHSFIASLSGASKTETAEETKTA